MIKIIGEIGLNANGDVNIAKKLIKMAKDCGADYVKTQTRTVETVYTKEFLDSSRESPWGTTQRAQKQQLEFEPWEYEKIDDYCKEIGIEWFASCWDLEALKFIEEFKPPLHKIASPMITNMDFLEEVAKLGRKTLISTGMSQWEDIDRAVHIFQYHKCPFVLMHCVSVYPCDDNLCNIEVMKEFHKRYNGVEMGYSGHEIGLTPSILAVCYGAEWIERHITLGRSLYGSDQSASLEKPGFERLVKYCREVKPILGDGVKKILKEEAINAKKMRYWEKV